MSLDTDVALLRQLDIFREIDPVRLHVLSFAAERRMYAPGEALFEAGDAADAAYLIVGGEAVMLAADGQGETQVSRLRAGDLIGEAALLLDGPRRSTARAATDLEVMAIKRDLFQRLLAEFPEMAAGLVRGATGRLEALAADIRALDDRIESRRAARVAETSEQSE